MKPIVIALSVSLWSLHALASEATLFDDHVASTKTRAEVRAEVADALARGTPLSWGEGPAPASDVAAVTHTRAEVLADVQAARMRGEVPDGEATLHGRL
jgi:hypothetical protein